MRPGSPAYPAWRRSIRRRLGHGVPSKAIPLRRWYPAHFLFGEQRPRRTIPAAVFRPGSKRRSPQNRPAASANYDAADGRMTPVTGVVGVWSPVATPPSLISSLIVFQSLQNNKWLRKCNFVNSTATPNRDEIRVEVPVDLVAHLGLNQFRIYDR